MRKTETVEWKTLDQKIFRSCHQLISYEDSIFLFFGETQVQHLFSYKVGKYNLLTNELVELSPVFSPASRRNHVCVKKENFVYVFGGEYQRYSDGNELTKYNLDTNEWNLIYFENTDITPSCRIYHCGCSCSKDIYFFGGEYLTEVQFEELWKLDENEKWNHIEPKSYYNPLGRRYASLESNNEYLYLFGGRNEEKRFNDLWQFNTLTCCWKEISTDGNEIPKPRASHTSIIKNNTMWIYGGNNGGITNELFSLDLFSFTWKKYETKNDFPRHWHAATVTNNNELIVHGGRHIQNLDDFILMELPISKNSLCNLLHKKLKKKEFVDILINF
eukprot:gene11437-4604_t